jgi:hypothetical protein
VEKNRQVAQLPDVATLLIFKIKRLELVFGDQPTVVRHLVQSALDHMDVEQEAAAELAQIHQKHTVFEVVCRPFKAFEKFIGLLTVGSDIKLSYRIETGCGPGVNGYTVFCWHMVLF